MLRHIDSSPTVPVGAGDATARSVHPSSAERCHSGGAMKMKKPLACPYTQTSISVPKVTNPSFLTVTFCFSRRTLAAGAKSFKFSLVTRWAQTGVAAPPVFRPPGRERCGMSFDGLGLERKTPRPFRMEKTRDDQPTTPLVGQLQRSLHQVESDLLGLAEGVNTLNKTFDAQLDYRKFY
jgi:hypothetical protein